MKDLCSRARAALNLLLLLSLLQIWVIFSAPNSPESINADIDALEEIFLPFIAEANGRPRKPLKPPLDKLVEALKSHEFKDKDDLTLALFEDHSSTRFFVELQRLFRSYADDNTPPPPTSVDGETNIAIGHYAVRHIQKLISRSGLPPTATIRELKHHYSGEMEVPILKQSIEPEDATVVMAVATVFPLALLYVLFDSMRKVLRKMKFDGEDIDPLDCILFYRSWSAIPVTVVWLILPLALFASQFQKLWIHIDSTPSAIAFLFSCIVPILSLGCLFQGLMARRIYLVPYPGEK